MMKIVVLDGYAANPGDLSWEPFREFGELTVYDRTAQSDVLQRASDADIIMTNKVIIDAGILSKLKRLKMIGVLATGFNVIDIEAAKQHDVVVCNIPAYSTNSVAQMVFAHILNITNQVDHYARQNREGRWGRIPDFTYWDGTIHELAGMTLGIVGLGNIGSKVATIAKDFGMDVFAFTTKNSSDLPAGIQKTTMDGLWGVSDILTLHCPLTLTTRELINKKSLKKMKHGAILINTARGPLVNEQDVADALQSGQLAGYGADVMCSEPPAGDNPLLMQPNAYITPHVAWATKEARTRMMEIALSNMKAFIDGNPQNVVNP